MRYSHLSRLLLSTLVISVCAALTALLWSPDGRRGFDAVFNFSMAEGLRDALGRDGPLLRIILPPASVRLLLPENPLPAFPEAGT